RVRATRFFAVHRERAQDLAARRKNRSRPAGTQTADLRQFSVVGPERIGQHIFDYDRLAQIHRCSAGAIPRPNRRAIDGFDISLRQIWRRAVPHMLPVVAQEQDGTAQSVGLPFHEKNEARKNLGKRGVGCDHFQNAALIEKEKFLLFDFRYVAANDHPSGELPVRALQWAAANPRPESIGRFLVPDEYLNIIYLL